MLRCEMKSRAAVGGHRVDACSVFEEQGRLHAQIPQHRDVQRPLATSRCHLDVSPHGKQRPHGDAPLYRGRWERPQGNLQRSRVATGQAMLQVRPRLGEGGDDGALVRPSGRRGFSEHCKMQWRTTAAVRVRIQLDQATGQGGVTLVDGDLQGGVVVRTTKRLEVGSCGNEQLHDANDADLRRPVQGCLLRFCLAFGVRAGVQQQLHHLLAARRPFRSGVQGGETCLVRGVYASGALGAIG
mmetsp:Transcript_69515/g.201777  ORF Transcript_69515/g.201777 Transcript_69515/m.201777 type:complete len:241 (+) Transcript_69515:386-1108(+)